MLDNRMNVYYLRSALKKDDGSCSIISQRECVKQFLNAHPELGSDFTEFIDVGYSGTNMERPSVQQLLKLIEQGRVRTIVVSDLSRFTRNHIEGSRYLESIFPANGVRFISINDQYDSSDENMTKTDLNIIDMISSTRKKYGR